MLHTERWIPPDAERVNQNIHPEAREEIHLLLRSYPELRGVGYSEFIMRAVRQTQQEIARSRAQRRDARDCTKQQATMDEEREYLIRVTRHPVHDTEVTTTDFVRITAADDASARDQAMSHTSLHIVGHLVEWHEVMPGGEFRELSC